MLFVKWSRISQSKQSETCTTRPTVAGTEKLATRSSVLCCALVALKGSPILFNKSKDHNSVSPVAGLMNRGRSYGMPRPCGDAQLYRFTHQQQQQLKRAVGRSRLSVSCQGPSLLSFVSCLPLPQPQYARPLLWMATWDFSTSSPSASART